MSMRTREGTVYLSLYDVIVQEKLQMALVSCASGGCMEGIIFVWSFCFDKGLSLFFSSKQVYTSDVLLPDFGYGSHFASGTKVENTVKLAYLSSHKRIDQF